MKTQTFPLFGLLLCLLALFSAPAALQAADLPAPEKAKIEALINQIGNLKDASFIRNGSSYDAATAAKFLRGKWNKESDSIANVSDFIDKAATKSSTSGQPYLIRYKDGREVECANWLREQLKKL
jgi:hypothetical protein